MNRKYTVLVAALLLAVMIVVSGIAEEDLPYVFERFYKGNDGQHGIGLAIAKSVTESYHGKIHAYNENGAVFEASFPQ